MPAKKTVKLVGIQFHPAFYEKKAQDTIDEYLETNKAPKDHAEAELHLAMPMLLFQIASGAAVRPRLSSDGGNLTMHPARLDAMFWEAYEFEPVFLAKLFTAVTAYNEEPVPKWTQDRHVVRQLLEEQAQGQPKASWYDFHQRLVNQFKLEGLSQALPKLDPKALTQKAYRINKKRRGILSLRRANITAYNNLKKSKFAVFHSSMCDGWQFFPTEPLS